jgi:polyhydroxyalkanoate synthesis repressor PhaR
MEYFLKLAQIMLPWQHHQRIIAADPFNNSYPLPNDTYMSAEPVRIKRYPNRRYYATHTSRYISLPEIEQLIRDGSTVEIIDSQTGEDLTQSILVQIIAEMHPEKIALLPSAMLHSMLRANKAMTAFFQAYFRASLTYLEQLQKQGAAGSFKQPMQWMEAWLENWPTPPNAKGAPKSKGKSSSNEDRGIAERISRLEERIAELEAKRGRKS